MKRVTAGQRNQYIVIEQDIGGKDEFNEPIEDWQPVTPAWAKITTKSSSENDESGRLKGVSSCSIITDWIEGITNTMRINHEGRYLNIIDAYDPDGTKAVLKIEAEFHG
jgi:SPP1 family predicted phage head-tail adaptor